MRLIGLGLLAMFALPACAPSEVALSYRFPPLQTTHYLWTIDGVVRINSPAEVTTRRITAVVEVDEIALGPTSEGRPRLMVSLRPVRIVEDEVASTPDLTVRIEIEVDGSGRVTRLFRTSNLPPGPLATLELDRIFMESRPILPPTPVGIGDRWQSPQRSRAENSSIHLNGFGKLLGFLVEDRARLALIEIKRSGEVRANQPVGRATASAAGRTTTHTRATIDIGRGLLNSSSSTSTSRFDLKLGGDNRAGEITMDITSTLELTSMRRLEETPPNS